MRFSIVTDSCSNLPVSFLQEHQIKVISLVFQSNGVEMHSYVEGETIDLTSFYAMMRRREPITTGSASPQACADIFRAELEAGRDVLYIGFSSALSATYQTAVAVLKELQEEFPERRIYAVDSLSAALGQGLLVTYAARLREIGKEIQEVAKWVEDHRLSLCHWFTVDDLFFLHRGGRVSKTAAIVGSMMGVKPILHVDEEGRLAVVEKVRGRKSSLDALLAHMKDTRIEQETQTVYIAHGDCEADALYVKEQVEKQFGISDILVYCLDPVIGCHAGPGTVALFYLGSHR